MVFKCHEDSFLKEYTSKVLSCEPASIDWLSSGDSSAVKHLQGFNIVLDNTILFPEGGGQPCDYGTIDGKPVRNVTRKGAEAVHFVESSIGFEIGADVRLSVDWERRLDHMQQHSGQHLISSLFESEFNHQTISWWLGSETSYIELDTSHLVSRESLDRIENMTNDLIIEGREVNVMMLDSDAAVEEYQDPRAKGGLPKDHVGTIRIVNIKGIESQMCCGTHVSNISQLQAVKLLHAEKAKNRVFVHFLVGRRVLKKLGDCYNRELQMNLALKGGPKSHLELIQKLQVNLKTARKTCQKLLKDIAIAESDKLRNASESSPQYYSLHRKDGIETDFIHTFLGNAPEGIFYFLTVSEIDGRGYMVLRGSSELVQKFGETFTQILDGRGNGKGNTYQAKINKSNKIEECELLLEEHFKAKDLIAES